MLQTLYVKNLALIDQAEVNFGPGLNILSGETGAGKSILIGSIHIALGGRVPRDMIRQNADSAYIELVFQVGDREAEALRKAGVWPEAGQLVISRKLTAGKSISRVNGEFWPAARIQEISGILLDVYGQHEHQTLLKKNHHLEILDEYCRDQTAEIRKQIHDHYIAYRQVQRELAQMQEDEASRKREMAFLQFAVDEICQAELREGEDEELAARYKKLVNQRQLAEGMEALHQLLGYDDKISVGEQISQAIHVIQRICSYDEEGLKDIQDQLYDLEGLVTDLNQSVSAYRDEIDAGEEDLSQVEERLDLIHDLKAKYGNSIAAVLEYRKEQQEKLDSLRNYDQHRNELQQQEKLLREALSRDCEELSRLRKAAAKEMEERIIQALLELNFLQIQFQIQFSQSEDFMENGRDLVEFMISTNPGEPLKPLVQVASGGELSRIMLAVKTVLADMDHVPTLIFDEIDAGISGRTAQMVSEKLAYISKEHQVVCISHLPQIVSMADDHYLIEKTSDGDSTNTRIRLLEGHEPVQEIARLLGGAEITKTTFNSAEEMKAQASERKKQIRS